MRSHLESHQKARILHDDQDLLPKLDLPAHELQGHSDLMSQTAKQDPDGELSGMSSSSQETFAYDSSQIKNDGSRNDSKEEVPSFLEQESSFSATTWPIIFAIAPASLSLVFGNSIIWGEILVLALVLFYLYMILKVPWELYLHAKCRRVSNRVDLAGIQKTGTSADVSRAGMIEDARNESLIELKRLELQMLLLFLSSPIVGGLALHFVRLYVMKVAVISEFHILLFTLAASIKPLMHLISLAKEKTANLQREIHHPTTEVDRLKSKITSIEAEITKLKINSSTRSETDAMRESLHSMISSVAKAVKRLDRRVEQVSTLAHQKSNSVANKTVSSQTLLQEKHHVHDKVSNSQASPIIPSNLLSGTNAFVHSVDFAASDEAPSTVSVDRDVYSRESTANTGNLVRPSTPSSTSSRLREPQYTLLEGHPYQLSNHPSSRRHSIDESYRGRHLSFSRQGGMFSWTRQQMKLPSWLPAIVAIPFQIFIQPAWFMTLAVIYIGRKVTSIPFLFLRFFYDPVTEPEPRRIQQLKTKKDGNFHRYHQTFYSSSSQ